MAKPADRTDVYSALFARRTPCDNCPFRSDGAALPLHPNRILEIGEAVMNGECFGCHKTIAEPIEERPWPFLHYCAGSMLFDIRQGFWSKGMLLGRDFGLFDPARLDRAAPIFEGIESLLEWHVKQENPDAQHGH